MLKPLPGQFRMFLYVNAKVYQRDGAILYHPTVRETTPHHVDSLPWVGVRSCYA
jgi:hypothetical protein